MLLFCVDFYSGGRVSHIKAGVNALGIFWSKIIKYNCMEYEFIILAELIVLPPKYPKCAEAALVC